MSALIPVLITYFVDMACVKNFTCRIQIFLNIV